MCDYEQMVADLAVEHRAKDALRRLMAAGPSATRALRGGLRHSDPVVRAGCCVVLDHFLDAEALPELIANLDHEDERVRSWALHALACDRCKEGECRPGEDDVLPITLRMLAEDPSRFVRAQAAQLLGKSNALHRPDVIAALERARDTDAHPNVRKIAGRFAPGGSVYRRVTPGERMSAKAGPRRPYPRKVRGGAAPGDGASARLTSGIAT